MATHDIYIDSSFFELDPYGFKLVTHELSFDPPDKIGGRNIPLVLEYITTTLGDSEWPLEYIVTQGIDAPGIEVDHVYVRHIGTVITDLTILAEYTSLLTIASGTYSVNMDYFNREQASLAAYPIGATFVTGAYVEAFNSVALGYKTFSPITYWGSIRTNYVNFTGDYDYWGDPIGSVSGTEIVLNMYETQPNTLSGVQSSYIDVTFSDWVPGFTECNVYSVWENIRDGEHYYFPIDVTTRSGGLTGVVSDVFSTTLDTMYMVTDLYSAGLKEPFVKIEVASIPGINNKIDFDVWSVHPDMASMACDVRLLTMYFDNFSLAVGEYMTTSGTICVNVHDEMYSVVTSGTYFMVNDVPVSGTLTPISDGYTICYNPYDDFMSLSGPTKFTAHAENSNGDILTRDYYVTFGYVVEYDNFRFRGMDFGLYNKIGVRMSASNLMNCPIDDADGFWFVSKDYGNADLSASITVVPSNWVSDQRDLSTSIYPQSTAYFYDKVFRMELNVKDYGGNAMAPFVLVFKVENLSEE